MAFAMQDALDQCGQDKHLWKSSFVAFHHHHAVKNNTEPAVLFLVHEKPGETVNKLSAKLAQLYSHSCEDKITIIDGTDFQTKSSSVKLHAEIISGFENGACALVVNNFEKIDPSATMMFYGFCENDRAPYKNAAIIFTMHMNSPTKKYEKLYSAEWESSVYEFIQDSLLSRSTDNMIEERIGGLLSRITPYMSFVKPEDSKCV